MCMNLQTRLMNFYSFKVGFWYIYIYMACMYYNSLVLNSLDFKYYIYICPNRSLFMDESTFKCN